MRGDPRALSDLAVDPPVPFPVQPYKRALTHTRPAFVRAEWGAEEEDAEDVTQWEEDWDDTETNDDFTKQLRAELERFGQ